MDKVKNWSQEWDSNPHTFRLPAYETGEASPSAFIPANGRIIRLKTFFNPLVWRIGFEPIQSLWICSGLLSGILRPEPCVYHFATSPIKPVYSLSNIRLRTAVSFTYALLSFYYFLFVDSGLFALLGISGSGTSNT